MSIKESIKLSIIQWNNIFPLDRQFREKYSIPFNSKQHQKTCQIDIFFDMMESKMISNQQSQYVDRYKKMLDYQNSGKMFVISKEDEDNRFDKFLPVDNERFINVNELE